MTLMFMDEPAQVARFDKPEYPWIMKLHKKQRGFFWQPEEIPLSKDSKDFRQLPPNSQHIFTANIKRQIVLDSKQGKAPLLAFGPLSSVPEMDTWLSTWTFFENIHSESYTHIIQNIYSDPSAVLDNVMDVIQIYDLHMDISEPYDRLITHPTYRNLYECLVAVNALEGIRFYVSFACSWAFAEQGLMEGNAKIIKMIARDENVHLAFTQQCIKQLTKQDSSMTEVLESYGPDIYTRVIDQEIEWARYLFKDGAMLGLNFEILEAFIYWLGYKRATAIGITLPDYIPRIKENPLPWIQKWIGGVDVQNAPQEVEETRYIIGGIKQDVSADTFKGLTL